MSTEAEWGTTRHGTPSGYARHTRLSERPCDPCYRAKADYDRRRRSSPQAQVRDRVRALAQSRAHRDLARAHREEYYLAYERHLKELRSERGDS